MRPYGLLERLMFRAGVHDQVVARALDRFGGRLVGPGALLAPALLARMVWVNLAGPVGAVRPRPSLKAR